MESLGIDPAYGKVIAALAGGGLLLTNIKQVRGHNMTDWSGKVKAQCQPFSMRRVHRPAC
jgi:hypothetical protein